MRLIRTKREKDTFFQLLNKRALGSIPGIDQRVRAILSDVRKYGDKAVLKYTKTFDSLKTSQLAITPEEVVEYAEKADPKVVKALRLSAKRIKAFHSRQKEKSWFFSEEGTVLGQVIRPIDRVGVYIPGGKASYPSTVLMNEIGRAHV
jgi:histidinol dehydrogenase